MNVITIVSDTLRADYLACYGNPWTRTPNFDRLAGSAVVFDRAYVHNFPTVPARCDMWTGRYTSAYFDWGPLPRDEIILSQVLSAGGVTTMLIGDTLNLFRDGYYFDRGFHAFHWIRGQASDRYQTDPRVVDVSAVAEASFDPNATLIPHLRSTRDRRHEEEYFPAQTFRDAARWLERNRGNQPFYLHIDTFDPHEPWDPPAWYVERYDPGYEGREIASPKYATADYLTPAELLHCRALYAGEVSLVDTWLGWFLITVENLGLLDSTAIIVTADHGFYLGEHGWIGKSLIDRGVQRFLPLYEEVARVPMLVYIPGIKPGRSGALVQPVDIAPTVLELLDIPAPAEMQGHSWTPLFTGNAVSVRDFAWSGPAVHHRGRYRPSTVTTADGWCLIYNGQVEPPTGEREIWAVDGRLREEVLPPHVPEPELYYLPDDPRQGRNLFLDHRDRAEKIRSKHLDMLEQLGVSEEALELRRR
jgi:arylsulfatase A-like enzyme